MKRIWQGVQACTWARWMVFPIDASSESGWFNFRVLDLAAQGKSKKWYSLAHNGTRYAENKDYWHLLANEGENILFDIIAVANKRWDGK